MIVVVIVVIIIIICLSSLLSSRIPTLTHLNLSLPIFLDLNDIRFNS